MCDPNYSALYVYLIMSFQAYWLLDNEDFDEAVAMLLDPLVHTSDIKEEEHRAIMLGLLTQGHPKLALKYCNVRKPPLRKAPDVQLHLSILLANGMVHEAFQLVRNQRSQGLLPPNGDKLFHTLLINAEKMDKLGLILQLNLQSAEDRSLTDFLQKSTVPSSQEILLEYYLQRARYQEATRLHQHMRASQSLRRTGPPSTRQAIIDRYAKLIPGMTSSRPAHGSYPQHKIQPSIFFEPTPIEVSPSNAMTPVFRADYTEVSGSRSMASQQPHPSNAFTPFRPRHRRGTGSRIPIEFPPDSPATLPSKAQSILHTPVIVKNRSGLRKVSVEGGSQDLNDTGRCHTPQSILKVKRLMQFEENASLPLSPASVTKESEKSEDKEAWRPDSRFSRESTPGKSLRFNVPKKLPPQLAKEPEEELENASEKSSSHSSSDLEIIEDSPPPPKTEPKPLFDLSSQEGEPQEMMVDSDSKEEEVMMVDEDTAVEAENVSVDPIQDEEEIDEPWNATTAEVTVALSPSSRKSLIADMVQECHSDDETNLSEVMEEEDKEEEEFTYASGNVSWAPTPNTRKSIIADLVKQACEASFEKGSNDLNEEEKEEELSFSTGNTSVCPTPNTRKSIIADLVKQACEASFEKGSNELNEEEKEKELSFATGNVSVCPTPNTRKSIMAELIKPTMAESSFEGRATELTEDEDEVSFAAANVSVVPTPNTRKAIIAELAKPDEEKLLEETSYEHKKQEDNTREQASPEKKKMAKQLFTEEEEREELSATKCREDNHGDEESPETVSQISKALSDMPQHLETQSYSELATHEETTVAIEKDDQSEETNASIPNEETVHNETGNEDQSPAEVTLSLSPSARKRLMSDLLSDLVKSTSPEKADVEVAEKTMGNDVSKTSEETGEIRLETRVNDSVSQSNENDNKQASLHEPMELEKDDSDQDKTDLKEEKLMDTNSTKDSDRINTAEPNKPVSDVAKEPEEEVDIQFDFSQPEDRMEQHLKGTLETMESNLHQNVHSQFTFSAPVEASPILTTKRVIKKSQVLLEAIATETALKKSPEKYTKFLERTETPPTPAVPQSPPEGELVLQMSSSDTEENNETKEDIVEPMETKEDEEVARVFAQSSQDVVDSPEKEEEPSSKNPEELNDKPIAGTKNDGKEAKEKGSLETDVASESPKADSDVPGAGEPHAIEEGASNVPEEVSKIPQKETKLAEKTSISTPLRRSQRRTSEASTDTIESGQNDEIDEVEAKSSRKAALVTPLRRSQRHSQSSDDEARSVTELADTGESSGNRRAATPRSSAKKTSRRSSRTPLKTVSEESEESEAASSPIPEAESKSGRRKRRLSEVPALDMIEEEPSTTSTPRKSKRKSVSATAVLQRSVTERRQKNSKGDTDVTGKKILLEDYIEVVVKPSTTLWG